MATGHFSIQSGVADHPIAGPAELRHRLPAGSQFAGKNADSLRAVFGQVSAADANELSDWLVAIFPELEEASLSGWRALRPGSDHGAGVLPGRTWNPFRLHVEVPWFSEVDGRIEWVSGTICAIENALLVLWHESKGADIEVSARIDGHRGKGSIQASTPPRLVISPRCTRSRWQRRRWTSRSRQPLR